MEKNILVLEIPSSEKEKPTVFSTTEKEHIYEISTVNEWVKDKHGNFYDLISAEKYEKVTFDYALEAQRFDPYLYDVLAFYNKNEVKDFIKTYEGINAKIVKEMLLLES
jgi:hypothetical protein